MTTTQKPAKKRETVRRVAVPEGYVLMSKKRLERMREDLRDMAVIVERRNEKTYSWEDLKVRLKREGLL
ncbi:MAG: hypothetical protein Q7T26_02800 [Dehalococcoidia bacterium]|nr:hypothetical protein [Dehalococcoidia bacterium]